LPDWPHAPVHRLTQAGAYMVTVGTYHKRPFLRGPDRLRLVHDALLELAMKYGWELQAWAVLANHYHFVALSPQSAGTLPRLLSELHTTTATALNALDAAPGRKIWFQYWDKHLTFMRSYLPRLNYVHNNPVKHGLVADAIEYPWCSARWFEENAPKGFKRTVRSFRTDRLDVPDDF